MLHSDCMNSAVTKSQCSANWGTDNGGRIILILCMVLFPAAAVILFVVMCGIRRGMLGVSVVHDIHSEKIDSL